MLLDCDRLTEGAIKDLELKIRLAQLRFDLSLPRYQKNKPAVRNTHFYSEFLQRVTVGDVLSAQQLKQIVDECIAISQSPLAGNVYSAKTDMMKDLEASKHKRSKLLRLAFRVEGRRARQDEKAYDPER